MNLRSTTKVKKTSVDEEYSSEVLFRAVSCHLTKLFHGDEIVENDGKLMIFGFMVNTPNKSYFHQESSYYTILFLAILLP